MAAWVAPAVIGASTLAGSLLGQDRSDVDRSPGLQESLKNILHQAYPYASLQATRLPQVQSNLGPSGSVGTGISMLGGAARGIQPTIDRSLQQWQSNLGAQDVANNPYVTQFLDQLGTRSADLFNRQMARIGRESPGIMRGQGRAGQQYLNAMERAQEAFQRTAAGAQLQAYGQGLGHEARMLGLTPSLTGAALEPGRQMINAGQIEQQQRLNQATGEMARAQGLQNYEWGPVQNWVNMHTTGFGQSATVPRYNPSGAAVGAGLGMMAAPFVQSMMGPSTPAPATQSIMNSMYNPAPVGPMSYYNNPASGLGFLNTLGSYYG